MPIDTPPAMPDAPDMATLVRDHDWSATPLGPMAAWPQSLRTPVRMMLTSRFAMWMGWGPELTFLYNDAYGRMTLGAKHPWALGRPSHDVWAEIWDDVRPRVRHVLETGEATWDEQLLLFLERSGYREETYHTFSYSPLSDDDGVVAGLLCVVVEETERVIGERRLATLRDLGAELGTTTTERGVLDVVRRVVGANARDLPFTALYLFDAAEPAGRATARLAAMTGIVPGHAAAPCTIEAGDAAAWPIDAVLAGESPTVDDLATRFATLPSGAWSMPPESAVVAPIARRGQERRTPAGFLVAGLSPHRPLDAAYRGFVELVAGQIAASLANARAYEEERARAEALAELDRAKTQFFSNVSHEFRTPLTLMLGPAEDVLADPDTRSVNRERAAVIHRNALRLLKLVNTMLDFTRIEAGRVRASYEPTDVGAYTAELASSFRSAMERAGLHLVVDTAQAQGVVAHLDRDMWEKVILNLLSNAFKHTFDGEVAVRVAARRDAVVVTIADTGVGIPAEQLPRIFERFHRVPHARSRTHEGTGIGLALVQELVRLHGGTIDVASQPGEGTTFTLTIPLGSGHLPGDHVTRGRDADRADGPSLAMRGTAYVEEATRWVTPAADSPSDPVAASAESTPSTARILVADDNADMREYVTRLLRERGWTVQAVADGRAALDAVRRDPPDLVLSDVMMPGLDGFALLAALSAEERTRAVPVLLLSARAGEEARVGGLEAGAADYLVKPFAARELVARVDAQLHRAHEVAAMQRERARLEELFAQAPAAIAVMRGPRHVYESANPLYLQLLGGRDDIVGRPVREALPELAGQGIYELLDEVYASGHPFVGEGLRVMLADAGGALVEHFFNFVYQPLRGSDGAVTGIFVHCVDVTEQVRARRDAEDANRAKSDFLAAMSHELRTPLNAIGGYVELIDMGIHGPVTEPQHAALARVQHSQRHLLSLINDVLNFAKLEAGRVEYDVDDVRLADVVASVTPMIEPQLVAKGLAARADVDAALVARADREKLEQILLNLLSNAVKFTDAGGEVMIDAARAADGTMALTVADTGIGIPAERLDNIFEPFVQVRNVRVGGPGGTGLGLAISRDLARGMGGDLTVESRPGAGSRFTLMLPAAP